MRYGSMSEPQPIKLACPPPRITKCIAGRLRPRGDSGRLLRAAERWSDNMRVHTRLVAPAWVMLQRNLICETATCNGPEAWHP